MKIKNIILNTRKLKTIKDELRNFQEGIYMYHCENDSEFADNVNKDMDKYIKRINDIIINLEQEASHED